jgi:hypothetical protein
MNRRSFLRGLIAAPAIVAASSIMPSIGATQFAQGGIIPPGGLMLFGEHRLSPWDQLQEARREYERVLALAQRGYPPAIDQYGEAANDLHTAARDFHLEPHLRDTAEPQAPVSPDKENKFPTADQDDTRQSAHVSDTLIPNSACRLSRSWGAV